MTQTRPRMTYRQRRKLLRALDQYASAITGNRPRKSLGTLIGGLLAVTLTWFLTVWLAMLCIGAAHTYDHRVPAFGYMATGWVSLALAIVILWATPRRR